ncbi:MAG: hypothetical protein ACPKOI_05060 [Pleomorphochaeta sp.]
MIRKLLLIIASLILCLPLYASPQVMINTNVDGVLTLKRYYQEISEATDISTGEFFIDADGVHSSVSEVTNPFNINAGFTTQNFIVTFFGSTLTSLSHQIDATITNYYLLNDTEKVFVTQSPTIINKTPSNGILTFLTGEYYDSTNLNLPTFTFQIQSPEYSTIGAGRYYADITISIVEN